MKIVISGAGIGGLALAQGLRRDGHDVVVLERGGPPEGPSGYRLRLDTRAVEVLGRLLAPEVWTALLASGEGYAVTRQLAYSDHRLRRLGTAPEDSRDVLMIGRGPLRRLLSHGLGDVIRYRAEACSFRVERDSASVVLADGRVETADLVVIAEGVHSRLAPQLLGHTGYRSLGVTAVCGRLPGTATEHGLDGVAEAVRTGYSLTFGPRGLALFLSAHDPAASGQAVDPGAVGPVPPEIEPAYLVWALLGSAAMVPDARDRSTLRPMMESLVRSWHPDFGRLPGLSDPESVLQLKLTVATESAPAWPTSAVTVLGDAVHAVPPTGGIGASTAIRDAGNLVESLRVLPADGAGVDRATLLRALHEYERTMRGYIGDVVAHSIRPLRWQRLLARPAVHAAATGVLAGIDGVRRRIAADQNSTQS